MPSLNLEKALALLAEQRTRPKIAQAEDNHGKIVAIDIETGAFEVAKDSLTASDQLLARLPDAQIWFVRIGHRAVHRVGLIEANLFQ